MIIVRRLWLFAALAMTCIALGMIVGVMYREVRTNERSIWDAFVFARSQLAATTGLLLLAALIALGAAGVHIST